MEYITTMSENNNIVKTKIGINYQPGLLLLQWKVFECDINSQIHSKELFAVIDCIFQLPYWI